MYPPIEPYDSGMLEVGDGHSLYWELCGNPRGISAVFLHGGPGAGSPVAARQLFDPQAYKLLLFDQRGAGRSLPHGGLAANTTWHLVADLERLREMIGADHWLVFGGSWGSTLALAYAQRHPTRVSALVLRGVFTGRTREIDWIYRGGARWIFPEAWDAFLALLTEEEQADPVGSYYRRLTGDGAAVRTEAALAWSAWEGRIVQLRPTPELECEHADPVFATALARIEAHYMAHRCWLEEGQLFDDACRLHGIPGRIVQGRYDICTPALTAWELHKLWPESNLTITPTSGHRFDEPETLAALVTATDGLRGHCQTKCTGVETSSH